MYENTGTRAHVMAAELIEAGVDVHEIYRRLYEGMPESQARRCSRARWRTVARYDDGALTFARLTRADFAVTGAEESYTEGIIDHLRSVQGTKVAALSRELVDEERRGTSKVSLRATDGAVDVSVIARAQGGGGHRQAAGFTTAAGPRRARRLPARGSGRAARHRVSADGVLLIDKPAGKTSHDVVAAMRREHRDGKVGHAGTLDPFATGLLLVLLGRATRVQRYLMALPKAYETVALLGATSTTGDPEGEIVVTGRVPPDPPVLPTGAVRQRPPAYSAIKIDGRRAYARARAGEDLEMPERTVTVHRFEQLWRDADPQHPRAAFAIECSSGTYVRSLVADLGDAYCVELRRTAIGPFSVADADPARVVGLADALSFLPSLRLEGAEARRAAHGVAVGEAPEGATEVLLLDAEGPIAVAEPRDGMLKPVVGFRG